MKTTGHFPQLTGGERSAMLRELDKAKTVATNDISVEHAIKLIANVLIRLLES